MAVKALVKISDRDAEGKVVEYLPGYTIANLPKAEEERLISLGYAEQTTATESPKDLEEDIPPPFEGDGGEGPDTGYPGVKKGSKK
jgi:hypothetical protein